MHNRYNTLSHSSFCSLSSCFSLWKFYCLFFLCQRWTLFWNFQSQLSLGQLLHCSFCSAPVFLAHTWNLNFFIRNLRTLSRPSTKIAYEPDGIPSTVDKNFASELTSCLGKLFHLCLCASTFPCLLEVCSHIARKSDCSHHPTTILLSSCLTSLKILKLVLKEKKNKYSKFQYR